MMVKGEFRMTAVTRHKDKPTRTVDHRDRESFFLKGENNGIFSASEWLERRFRLLSKSLELS